MSRRVVVAAVAIVGITGCSSSIDSSGKGCASGVDALSASLTAARNVSGLDGNHHFPVGMEELAEAALEASGAVVADALREALDAAPNAGEGVVQFLDIAWGATTGEQCAGCPIAPTALESPIISPRLRAVAARCFDEQEALIAARLRADGWPEGSAPEAASGALALIEGALLLGRVSGQLSHLVHAKRALLALLAAPPAHATGEPRKVAAL